MLWTGLCPLSLAIVWHGSVKPPEFQYTNYISFGHVWPRTKGVRLTNSGSPVYNRSSQQLIYYSNRSNFSLSGWYRSMSFSSYSHFRTEQPSTFHYMSILLLLRPLRSFHLTFHLLHSSSQTANHNGYYFNSIFWSFLSHLEGQLLIFSELFTMLLIDALFIRARLYPRSITSFLHHFQWLHLVFLHWLFFSW